jgi:heterodisulfide reductase subunit A-like polyferredoxin
VSDPVLVIGAGVAGMTVAAELADAGIKVVLVERSSTMGGNALDLYEAFPTDDCFYCFEGNRWRPGIRKCFYRSAMIDQPNIDVRTTSEVVDVSGKPGEFKVRIAAGPRYVEPKRCTMCGLCIELSKAFYLVSPQCQPQAVIYDSQRLDEGAEKAEQECPTKAINLQAQPSEETSNLGYCSRNWLS